MKAELPRNSPRETGWRLENLSVSHLPGHKPLLARRPSAFTAVSPPFNHEIVEQRQYTLSCIKEYLQAAPSTAAWQTTLPATLGTWWRGRCGWSPSSRGLAAAAARYAALAAASPLARLAGAALAAAVARLIAELLAGLWPRRPHPLRIGRGICETAQQVSVRAFLTARSGICCDTPGTEEAGPGEPAPPPSPGERFPLAPVSLKSFRKCTIAGSGVCRTEK